MMHTSGPLRQAVRPAILAYEVLNVQRRNTSPLVDEAKQLLTATEQLLEALGLAEASQPADKPTQVTHSPSEPAARFASFYAQAGMAWAHLAACAMSFATELLHEDDVSGASRLATSLADIGEEGLASELVRRIISHISSSIIPSDKTLLLKAAVGLRAALHNPVLSDQAANHVEDIVRATLRCFGSEEGVTIHPKARELKDLYKIVRYQGTSQFHLLSSKLRALNRACDLLASEPRVSSED